MSFSTTALRVLPATDDPPAGLPASPAATVKALAALWRDYLRREDARDVEDAELERRSQAAAPDCLYAAQFEVDRDRGSRQKTARNIVALLAALAEKHFAPAGGTLSIDRGELNEFVGELRDEDAVRSFSIPRIWLYLNRTYGAGLGEVRAHQQTATALLNCFRLDERPPQFVSGYACLSETVWTERNHRGRELSYGSKERVALIFNSFCSFLEAVNEHATAAAMRNIQLHLTSWQTTLVSREKFNAGEMVVVTMFERLEFRLSPSVAEKLKIFLATYAAKPRA